MCLNRKIYLALTLMIIASFADAGTWIRGTTITDVRWYGSTGETEHGYITTANTSNKECEGAPSNGNRYLSVDTLGNNKLISMALSAMMAGNKVDILVESCHKAKHSKIIGLVVKSK